MDAQVMQKGYCAQPSLASIAETSRVDLRAANVI